MSSGREANQSRSTAPSVATDNSNEQKLENSQSSSSLTSLTSDASYIAPDTVKRAKANPASLTPTNILALQRTVGNQAVMRLLATRKAAPPTAAVSTTSLSTTNPNPNPIPVPAPPLAPATVVAVSSTATRTIQRRLSIKYDKMMPTDKDKKLTNIRYSRTNLPSTSRESRTGKERLAKRHVIPFSLIAQAVTSKYVGLTINQVFNKIKKEDNPSWQDRDITQQELESFHALLEGKLEGAAKKKEVKRNRQFQVGGGFAGNPKTYRRRKDANIKEISQTGGINYWSGSQKENLKRETEATKLETTVKDNFVALMTNHHNQIAASALFMPNVNLPNPMNTAVLIPQPNPALSDAQAWEKSKNDTLMYAFGSRFDFYPDAKLDEIRGQAADYAKLCNKVANNQLSALPDPEHKARYTLVNTITQNGVKQDWQAEWVKTYPLNRLIIEQLEQKEQEKIQDEKKRWAAQKAKEEQARKEYEERREEERRLKREQAKKDEEKRAKVKLEAQQRREKAEQEQQAQQQRMDNILDNMPSTNTRKKPRPNSNPASNNSANNFGKPNGGNGPSGSGSGQQVNLLRDEKKSNVIRRKIEIQYEELRPVNANVKVVRIKYERLAVPKNFQAAGRTMPLAKNEKAAKRHVVPFSLMVQAIAARYENLTIAQICASPLLNRPAPTTAAELMQFHQAFERALKLAAKKKEIKRNQPAKVRMRQSKQNKAGPEPKASNLSGTKLINLWSGSHEDNMAREAFAKSLMGDIKAEYERLEKQQGNNDKFNAALINWEAKKNQILMQAFASRFDPYPGSSQREIKHQSEDYAKLQDKASQGRYNALIAQYNIQNPKAIANSYPKTKKVMFTTMLTKNLITRLEWKGEMILEDEENKDIYDKAHATKTTLR